MAKISHIARFFSSLSEVTAVAEAVSSSVSQRQPFRTSVSTKRWPRCPLTALYVACYKNIRIFHQPTFPKSHCTHPSLTFVMSDSWLDSPTSSIAKRPHVWDGYCKSVISGTGGKRKQFHGFDSYHLICVCWHFTGFVKRYSFSAHFVFLFCHYGIKKDPDLCGSLSLNLLYYRAVICNCVCTFKWRAQPLFQHYKLPPVSRIRLALELTWMELIFWVWVSWTSAFQKVELFLFYFHAVDVIVFYKC